MENSAYQAFSIPTPSMEPSIQVGDKVMATSFDIEKIQLGDVVVFQAEDGGSYLGRVMGLPNQQIAIKNHRAVYGQEAEKWLKKGLLEKDENIFYQGYEYQKYESTLPNGRKFTIRKDIKYNRQELKPGHSANMEAQVVPAGRVFILGDNRTNSVDSRMYGTIALNQIKKRINYIWWSRDKGRIGLQLNK
jgi:signal peptidase I